VSLARYKEKRKFSETPEPAPKAEHVSKKGALQYCVQRHHASHLHYDLRLEVDGALKSWAVPKGPTLDPNEKRLAMMVEDHPLEYGGFEGVIPKGNYGAGSVMLWDRGTYELLGDATAEEQLARGDFKFRVDGEKIKGDFAIVHIKRGKGNEWLLIKKKDAAAQPGWDPEDHARSALTGRTQEEIARGLEASFIKPKSSGTGGGVAGQGSKHSKGASAKPNRHLDKVPGAVAGPMPRDVAPMLAEIGKGTPPSGDDWIYEVKWDGVRAMCYVDGGELRLISRRANAMERQYPELSILPHHVLAHQAVIDGEIAALDERGLPSFGLLQHRITVGDAATIARLARSKPVVFFAFDLLYLDGYDLRGAPLVERKRLLKEVLKLGDLVRYSEHFVGNGVELLDVVKQQGLEGIVGKRAKSLYSSRRSGEWVKWKILTSAEFVICGFTEGERDKFGALVLGIYDRGKLVWAGNVGTGFDRKMIEAIHAKLVPLEAEQSPFGSDAGFPPAGDGAPQKLPRSSPFARGLPREVNWVRPELVCEVRFSNWTADRKLRAPSFLGLRPDIDPSECLREPGDAAARPVLLAPGAKEEMLSIDGHRLKFTNLDKVYYPQEGYKKRDPLNYYDAVAPLILPHLKDRPLSLKRYPNGIAGEYFFQKEIPESFPKWLRTGLADGKRHAIGDNRATLLFLVNLGCIDHNPWMSRMGSLEHPDYMLIDLDPQECSYEKIVEAALLVRGLLDRAELESYPKTTGGDGMHLFVPLVPRYSYEQVRSLAEALAAMAAAARPDLFTTPRAVARRQKGRVYFDWAQIAQGKTISAPYVLRAHPGAPVATPLSWNEVTPRLRPEQFHIGNALDRFDRVGDLFEGVLKRPQTLESAIEKLAGGK